mmetsp:Transcript_7899/g.10019  ORF Transcript_7899/g.10019 Transcript_7899/m.10019 type:complete len:312 (+) Transcript_7899:228-1163(+)|eukprot:CAMPEP_0204832602 /NCGR_PEP_ID=MMETSP1346-20131115/14283_1 /ASSEMBLY_ACC=CAM_ASM_000771 /TAXON_ID=215587 /ORGANISM="Aplanochytrium stocchinoi, Strain GSBS06" /LENGTH=311 /DNA_ID=CAMNT_0051964541 /DNA_START=201 /DNA_END=1136 /DNA_ORIENTATION=-
MFLTKNVQKLRAGGLSKIQSRGFAENPNDIAKRIASTQSIQKITKSMKMVSAAKLRGDTNRLMDGRPFGTGFDKMFNAEPMEEETPLPEYKKPLYVLISSDRGLCGGVNSFVCKAVKAAVDADVEKGLTPRVLILGDKGGPQMARSHAGYVLGSIGECWKQPMNFKKAVAMAERIASVEDVDFVKICYNRFVNSIAYETEFRTVTNFSAFIDDEAENPDLPVPVNRYEVEYESTQEALQNLYEYGLAVELYGCLIESATSEQSARMTAMDNASKNAGEMVDKLTVQYNRARQSRITTELIEIISGAESLKG